MVSDRHAEAQRRAVWPPAPGLFAMRLVARGWQVPCRILRHPGGTWQAEINGRAYASNPDPAFAPMVERVWVGGRIIDRLEYDWLIATREWAEVHAPEHPAVRPNMPIDPRTLSPILPAMVPAP